MPSQATPVQPRAADEIEYRYVRGEGWVAGYWSDDDFIAEQLRILSESISESVFRQLSMPPITIRAPSYVNYVTITGTVEV